MLSSAVLSYRLGTNSSEGKKKIGLNQQMAPSFPAPGLRQTYYTPTHIQPQSITFPPHVHMPTRYRDGYISSHACMQPYLCARRREGCCRPRSHGDGGGMEGGVTLKHSEPRAILGESAAWVRSFTSEGEERSVPS